MIINQDMSGLHSLVRRIAGCTGLFSPFTRDDRGTSRVIPESEVWPLGAEGWIAEAATPGRGALWAGR
jgi:hypothetical protein